MNKLDEALVDLRQNLRDAKTQSAFYDLFLNTSFFVPILSDGAADAGDGTQEVLPLIAEADGKDFLMLFSTLERMTSWNNGEEIAHIELPGHVLAVTSIDPLHWAMNVGTEFSKQFHPGEIEWLRQSVEICKTEAAKADPGCCG